jgi:hypothetical protein
MPDIQHVFHHMIDGKLVPCRPEMEVIAEVEEALTSDEVVEAVARIPWDNDFPGTWDKGVDPEDEEERDPRPSARADVRSCLTAALATLKGGTDAS